MDIQRIKTEVEFWTLKPFDVFQHSRKTYMKLPVLNVEVDITDRARTVLEKDGVPTHFTNRICFNEIICRFNAIEVDASGTSYDYANFKHHEMVRPLKSELKIYE